MINPTAETYTPLNEAFDFFNKELFKGKLPCCLITMQRKGKARGYFSPERFEMRVGEEAKVHEIALNPSLYRERSDEEILSTLVHEMFHLWQQEFGSSPKRSYHNMEWAKEMEKVGLMPSDTGEEGGRKTGHSMTHYIVPGGTFDVLIKKFFEQEGRKVLYQDRPTFSIGGSRKRNKIKYTCGKCGLNVWGKAGINIHCGSCDNKLVQNS